MGLEKAMAAKTALITLLGTAAAGRWTTVGYTGQSVAAERTLNNLRRVTVYYGAGSFPEGRSPRVAGPFRHEITIKVELMVSADAQVDLATLDDAESTPAQRQAALAAALDASERADAVWDELAGLVWDVLMRPANYDLGGAIGVYTDRWVPQVRKDEPQPRGSLMVLTGTLDYSVAASEVPTGVTPVAGESVDLAMGVTADVTGTTADPAKQGVEATQA